MTTQVQPVDKTVSVNGLKLNYLDWGNESAPDMVLVHGLRGHRHSWDDFSALVCKDFHVMALDQRGRGESDWAPEGDYSTDAYVADLAGFSEALGLNKFTLVGPFHGWSQQYDLRRQIPGKAGQTGRGRCRTRVRP